MPLKPFKPHSQSKQLHPWTYDIIRSKETDEIVAIYYHQVLDHETCLATPKHFFELVKEGNKVLAGKRHRSLLDARANVEQFLKNS